MQELLNFLTGLQSHITLSEALLAMGFSLVASLVTLLMYHLFYGSKNIGAGVNRTFLIGGPAVTAMFLVVRVSIPLAVGILGALSFVRFRTPVKDPAEIGYLLLLVAGSIGAATNNYLLVIILYVVVFIALGIQWLVGNRLTFLGRGQLMITLDQAAFPGLETNLKVFLKERLPGLSLETMSVLENRVSLHYQYRHRRGFDSAAMVADLNKMAGPANLEVFIG